MYIKSDRKIKIKKRISTSRRDPQFFYEKVTLKSLWPRKWISFTFKNYLKIKYLYLNIFLYYKMQCSDDRTAEPKIQYF